MGTKLQLSSAARIRKVTNSVMVRLTSSQTPRQGMKMGICLLDIMAHRKVDLIHLTLVEKNPDFSQRQREMLILMAVMT